MICDKCGATVSEDDAICPYCSGPLPVGNSSKFINKINPSSGYISKPNSIKPQIPNNEKITDVNFSDIDFPSLIGKIFLVIGVCVVIVFLIKLVR